MMKFIMILCGFIVFSIFQGCKNGTENINSESKKEENTTLIKDLDTNIETTSKENVDSISNKVGDSKNQKDTPKKEEKNTNIKEVSKTSGSIKTELIKCKGMHCNGCENSIKKEVKKLNGIQEVSADAKTNTVQVTYDNKLVKRSDIVGAINEAGYDIE